MISDTEGVLGEDPGDGSPLTEQFCQGKDNWCAYDIMGKLCLVGRTTFVCVSHYLSIGFAI